jgi:molybdopterin-guanine dinucleotide biosynthesis protein A
MDAVVTAGGRISGEFAERTGVTIKALLEVGGRPVIRTVVDALRGTSGVERIFVVGPEEQISAAVAGYVDEIIPESPDGATNFLMGLERCSGSRAVFAASDLPFLSAATLESFLKECPPEADFCYPVLHKDKFQAAYPQMTATFAPLRGGSYTGGCAFLLNPQALLANREMIDRVFASRKSVIKLASILGWTFCIRLLTRTADMETCAKRGSQLIGCDCRVADNCPPELTYDLDDLSDYEYAMGHVERLNA